MSERLNYINKKRKLLSAQDFAKTRNEAIRLAKEFSGKLWTDYNDHDPGVTIIEQFCYAMAELSFQADAHVKDLVFRGEGELEPDKLKTDFFLLPKPEENFATLPATDTSELPAYLSIQETFPENYGLASATPAEGDQLEFKQYLGLFDALLLDFSLRLQEFPKMLKKAGGANDTSPLGTLFAEAIKNIPGLEGTVDEKELKNSYSATAFTLQQQVELKQFMLARYGEVYDEDYQEDLRKLWDCTEKQFPQKWFKVLVALIDSYDTYAAEKRIDIFNVFDGLEANFEVFDCGLKSKLEILLKPIPGNVTILAKKVSEDGLLPSLYLQFEIDKKIEQQDEKEKLLQKVVDREFPFYLCPKVSLLRPQ